VGWVGGVKERRIREVDEKVILFYFKAVFYIGF